MPDHPQYQSQILDHLGLVAGMFDELGIGEILDHATQQDPERCDLTVGEAVKAMVLNGLGFVNQALYLVPMFFQTKPTHYLIAPRVKAAQLNDDALVLQRGFEMWCNAAHHSCVEGGQHDRPDRDDTTNGFGAPRY